MTDHMCSTSSRSSAETWESGSGGVGHVEAFLGERYVSFGGTPRYIVLLVDLSAFGFMCIFCIVHSYNSLP